MDQEYLAARILDRYRRDAIWLHEQYAQPGEPFMRTRFGGLPDLPLTYAWPRTSNGIPLHFFAQIDCSELPSTGLLPIEGVLFFFGRDDGEQEESGDCKVLFASALPASTVPMPAPNDLPPIGGHFPPFFVERAVANGETAPFTYRETRVIPRPFSTWPTSDALPPDVINNAIGGLRDKVRKLFESKAEANLRLLGKRLDFMGCYDDMRDEQYMNAYSQALQTRTNSIDGERVTSEIPRNPEQPSQMLGYAPSSQDGRKTTDPVTCLLSLSSYSSAGVEICRHGRMYVLN